MKTAAAKAHDLGRLQRCALRPAARLTRVAGNGATTAVTGWRPAGTRAASTCTRLTKTPAQRPPAASRSSRSCAGARRVGLVGGDHQHHVVHERRDGQPGLRALGGRRVDHHQVGVPPQRLPVVAGVGSHVHALAGAQRLAPEAGDPEPRAADRVGADVAGVGPGRGRRAAASGGCTVKNIEPSGAGLRGRAELAEARRLGGDAPAACAWPIRSRSTSQTPAPLVARGREGELARDGRDALPVPRGDELDGAPAAARRRAERRPRARAISALRSTVQTESTWRDLARRLVQTADRRAQPCAARPQAGCFSGAAPSTGRSSVRPARGRRRQARAAGTCAAGRRRAAVKAAKSSASTSTGLRRLLPWVGGDGALDDADVVVGGRGDAVGGLGLVGLGGEVLDVGLQARRGRGSAPGTAAPAWPGAGAARSAGSSRRSAWRRSGAGRRPRP